MNVTVSSAFKLDEQFTIEGTYVGEVVHLFCDCYGIHRGDIALVVGESSDAFFNSLLDMDALDDARFRRTGRPESLRGFHLRIYVKPGVASEYCKGRACVNALCAEHGMDDDVRVCAIFIADVAGGRACLYFPEPKKVQRSVFEIMLEALKGEHDGFFFASLIDAIEGRDVGDEAKRAFNNAANAIRIMRSRKQCAIFPTGADGHITAQEFKRPADEAEKVLRALGENAAVFGLVASRHPAC